MKLKEIENNKTAFSYDEIEALVLKAAHSVRKAYRNLGSGTFDDLVAEGWKGAIQAARNEKVSFHTNPKGYIYTFARGYMTHFLHRRSRIVHHPWAIIKDDQENFGHVQLFDNVQVAGVRPLISLAPNELVGMLDKFTSKDLKALNDGRELSVRGQKLMGTIREQFQDWFDNLYYTGTEF